jgi:multidrug efflux pump subunit AcrA (membrane-fusion protein)
MTIRLFRFSVLLLPAATVLLLTGCNGKTDITVPLPEIGFIRPEPVEYRPSVLCTGVAESKRSAEAIARSPGRVAEILVEEGTPVSAGDLLVRLENPELHIRRDQLANELRARRADSAIAEVRLLQARQSAEKQIINIERARAKVGQKLRYLEIARRALEQKRRLYEAGGIAHYLLEESESGLRDAELAYHLAEQEKAAAEVGFRNRDLAAGGIEVPADEEARKEALCRLSTLLFEHQVEAASAEAARVGLELVSAENRLRDLEVTAPLSGIVAAIHRDEADWVSAGDPLATVIDVSEIIVSAPVNERHRETLRPGLSAKLTVHPEKPIPGGGRVVSITPFIRTETRALRVRIRTPGSTGLLPGEIVFAEIVTGPPEERLFLPDRAVLHGHSDRREVFLLDRGRLRRRSLEDPVPTDEGYLVPAAILDAEWICASAQEFYTEGMEVKPRYEE